MVVMKFRSETPPKSIILTLAQADELLKRVQTIRTDIDKDSELSVSSTVKTDLENLERFVKEIAKPLKKKATEVPL